MEIKPIELKFTLLIDMNEEGSYTVTVPSLPGCITEGDTWGEAIANAREAIAGYIEALNRRAIELLAGTLVKGDFAIESEMARTAHEQLLRLADVQINCKYGDFNTSTKNPWRHGFGNIFIFIRA